MCMHTQTTNIATHVVHIYLSFPEGHVMDGNMSV